MQAPLGKAVVTTTTMDANLNHCLSTGKSLTGCLHFVNKPPIDWYSKKQVTVETATYGSEFVAAKQQQTRLWTLGRPCSISGHPLAQNPFYLVTIDLWSPVPLYLILH